MLTLLSRGFGISCTIASFPRIFDEFLFIFSGKALDLPFPFQCVGVTAAGFPVDKFQRGPAPGILGTPAGAVGFQTFFHIGGDAGIKSTVFTSEDIQIPYGFHVYFPFRRKGRAQGPPFVIT